MATYFDVEKKEFCEALETFLRERFKENYIGKCASGMFISKIGVNKISHFPVYFTIQVIEKNSDSYQRGVSKEGNYFTSLFTKERLEKNNGIFPTMRAMPFDGEREVEEYKTRQRRIQEEKKERVQKLLSALTKEEKKELLESFLDDIQNETEED